MKLESVKPAKDGVHKYVAHFVMDTGRDKHVKFGAKGYTDFILSGGDEERRKRYINRHRGMGENWSNPLTPGALSRYILWGETTSFDENVRLFRKRFGL